MKEDIMSRFFAACEAGDMILAKELLPDLPDINSKNERGWTALVPAVYHEHADLAKWLVANGADIHAANHKGTTIFMYAKTPVLKSKNTSLLSWLISQGADINARDMHGLTALDYIKQKEDTDWLADWLVERGAE